MTDGRYDSRRGAFDPSRSRNEAMDRSSRDDRGFFDRARDEVSSWFGDDDGRREREDRGQDFGRERSFDRYEQNPRYREEGRGSFSGHSSASSRAPRERGESYQPMAGDYGRSSGRDWSQRQSPEHSGSSTSPSNHAYDRQYAEWRERQISELDQDYHEYRRENQSRFDSEFSTWRGQRQTKRQLLGQVVEHMDVVGSDDQPVGKVDHIRRDRIILTKNDSPDGRHHSIACTKIDRVEGGRVFLDKTAEEAKREFSDDLRNRALGERDDQGEDGPHMLNRSFSGTY